MKCPKQRRRHEVVVTTTIFNCALLLWSRFLRFLLGGVSETDIIPLKAGAGVKKVFSHRVYMKGHSVFDVEDQCMMR